MVRNNAVALDCPAWCAVMPDVWNGSRCPEWDGIVLKGVGQRGDYVWYGMVQSNLTLCRLVSFTLVFQ